MVNRVKTAFFINLFILGAKLAFFSQNSSKMSKNPTKSGSNTPENVPIMFPKCSQNVPQMFPEKNGKLGNIDKKSR
jgi:hypothetical protein